MARKIQLKNKSGEILHPETEASAITDLVANPGGNGLTELTSIKIGDTSYSVATQQDLSGYATTTYVDNRVNAVLGGDDIAQAYDTMKEIADYLDSHDNYIDQLANTTGLANDAMNGVYRENKRLNPIFIPKHFTLDNIDFGSSPNIDLPNIDVEYTADMSQGSFEFKVYKHDGAAAMFKQTYSWNGEFVRGSVVVLDSNLISQAEANKVRFYFTKEYDSTAERNRICLHMGYKYDQYGEALPDLGYINPIMPASTDLTDGGSLLHVGDVHIPTNVSTFTNDAGYLTPTALNGYALQDNVPSALSDLNNDTGFITGASLSGYATETYVNNKVSEVVVPTKVSDLSNDSGFITSSALTGLASMNDVNGAYTAAVGQIPTLVSQLTNDAGYLTSHQSLNGYATESYVNSAIGEIIGTGEVAANFDTIKEVADYLTQHGSDYSALVTAVNGKADASDIPTKVSDLTNDAGYLTSHQSLAGYATESYVNTAVGAITVPTKTSDLTNDSGFLTAHQSLANYALKSEIPEKVSDITNDTGFITAASLAPYALAADVPTKVSDLTNDSGFLTSHQDISGKQDKLTAGTGISINSNNVISVNGIQGVSYQVISEFPQAGSSGVIYLKSKGGRNKDVYEEYIWVNNDFELIGSTEIDLSNYATKSEISGLLSSSTAASTYATKSEISGLEAVSGTNDGTNWTSLTIGSDTYAIPAGGSGGSSGSGTVTNAAFAFGASKTITNFNPQGSASANGPFSGSVIPLVFSEPITLPTEKLESIVNDGGLANTHLDVAFTDNGNQVEIEENHFAYGKDEFGMEGDEGMEWLQEKHSALNTAKESGGGEFRWSEVREEYIHTTFDSFGDAGLQSPGYAEIHFVGNDSTIYGVLIYADSTEVTDFLESLDSISINLNAEYSVTEYNNPFDADYINIEQGWLEIDPYSHSLKLNDGNLWNNATAAAASYLDERLDNQTILKDENDNGRMKTAIGGWHEHTDAEGMEDQPIYKNLRDYSNYIDPDSGDDNFAFANDKNLFKISLEWDPAITLNSLTVTKDDDLEIATYVTANGEDVKWFANRNNATWRNFTLTQDMIDLLDQEGVENYSTSARSLTLPQVGDKDLSNFGTDGLIVIGDQDDGHIVALFLNKHQTAFEDNGFGAIDVNNGDNDGINIGFYRELTPEVNIYHPIDGRYVPIDNSTITLNSSNQLTSKIPACPATTDGTFVLKATVSSGVVTYSWVSEQA